MPSRNPDSVLVVLDVLTGCKLDAEAIRDMAAQGAFAARTRAIQQSPSDDGDSRCPAQSCLSASPGNGKDPWRFCHPSVRMFHLLLGRRHDATVSETSQPREIDEAVGPRNP